jgi:putative nucleotidyltransferase with HDIG domain
MNKKLMKKSFLSRLGLFDRYNFAFILQSIIPLGILAYIVIVYVLPNLNQPGAQHTIWALTIMLFFLVFLSILGFFVSRAATRETVDTLRQTNERLTYLFDITQSLSQQSHLDILLENIVKAGLEMTGAAAGIVLLANEENETLRFEVSIGTGAVTVKEIPNGSGIAGWAAKNGELAIVNDVNTDTRYSKDLNVFPNFDTTAIIAAPLKTATKSFGVLELLQRGDGKPFSEDDASIVRSLAGQASIFIDNVRYRDDQQNYFFHTTEILIASLDGTRQFWKDHLKNTAQYCYLVGKKLELNDEDMKKLHYAALLHDIGFIKLNLKENSSKKILEMHPEVGYEMIYPIIVWKDVAPIIRYHHEHFDGTGYPHKLSGDEIPLTSRILAVAEAFDAITNKNSYRHDKMEFEDAVNEIKAYSGTYFDPDVVRAFTEVKFPKKSP